jgi:hypothetical protein
MKPTTIAVIVLVIFAVLGAGALGLGTVARDDDTQDAEDFRPGGLEKALYAAIDPFLPWLDSSELGCLEGCRAERKEGTFVAHFMSNAALIKIAVASNQDRVIRKTELRVKAGSLEYRFDPAPRRDQDGNETDENPTDWMKLSSSAGDGATRLSILAEGGVMEVRPLQASSISLRIE